MNPASPLPPRPPRNPSRLYRRPRLPRLLRTLSSIALHTHTVAPNKRPAKHKRPGAPSIAQFAMGGIASPQPATTPLSLPLLLSLFVFFPLTKKPSFRPKLLTVLS